MCMSLLHKYCVSRWLTCLGWFRILHKWCLICSIVCPLALTLDDDWGTYFGVSSPRNHSCMKTSINGTKLQISFFFISLEYPSTSLSKLLTNVATHSLVKHDVNPINQICLIYFHKHNYILIVEITYPFELINNLQQGYKLDAILMRHIGNIPLLLINMHMRFNCNIYMCMFRTLLCANIKL